MSCVGVSLFLKCALRVFGFILDYCFMFLIYKGCRRMIDRLYRLIVKERFKDTVKGMVFFNKRFVSHI